MARLVGAVLDQGTSVARVAALQVRSGPELVARVNHLLGSASEQGACLIALPPIELPGEVPPALARQHRVHLVACSVTRSGGPAYRLATLLGPEGGIAGTQRQTHLSPKEAVAGLSPGGDLAVFDSPAGRLGLLVHTDVRYPEVARLLCLMGATLLVNPIAVQHAPARDWERRLWREVQANQVFGLEAPLVGNGYGGRATIHAPLGMTPGNDGVLAQASTADGDEAVVADLDYVALQQTIDAYPIYRVLNYRVVRRYLPGLYRDVRVPSHDVVP